MQTRTLEPQAWMHLSVASEDHPFGQALEVHLQLRMRDIRRDCVWVPPYNICTQACLSQELRPLGLRCAGRVKALPKPFPAVFAVVEERKGDCQIQRSLWNVFLAASSSKLWRQLVLWQVRALQVMV